MKSESTITDVRVKNPGELNPLIVEFLNGDIPEDKLSTLKVQLKPYQNLTEKAVKIITPDNQKYLNNPIHKLLLDNKYIAIRNKKTNKIRLVEVGMTTMVNSLYFEKVAMKTDVRDTKEQVAAFHRLYGTKRAIRQLERKEAMDIDRSHVEVQINELLADSSTADSSTLNESLNKTRTELEEECLANLIPPCHRDAVDILNVYRVEDLITQEEISSLGDAVHKLLQCEKKTEKESVFMETYLPNALAKTEIIRVRLACLLYAEALVNYLRMPAKNLVKMSQSICPHSELIRDKILREFCVKTGNSLNRPLSMKDKAICYIIVLVLIACNYTIDLEKLSKIACYGYRKLKQLGRIIGLLPAGKGSSIHVLSLPLPPPVQMVKSHKAVNRR